MKISHINKVKKIKVVMEGAKRVYRQCPISRKDKTPTFSFRVFTIKPNGYTPFHKHPFEHVNYVIKGYGSVVDKKGNEHKIKKGDFILIMPDEKHQYKNKSTKNSFIMICGVPKKYE